MLNRVGFEKAELVGETGFNSTPKTKGVLFRAQKPEKQLQGRKFADGSNHTEETVYDALGKTPKPSVDAVLDKAYAIGCEKAKIINTSTVIIEKWTRWKCLYGCPFYNKDGYHPPSAPSVEETKEVLGEYSKAILLNGSRGKSLTGIAIQLEGEAYKMGFYKAFALTALPLGPGGETNAGST